MEDYVWYCQAGQDFYDHPGSGEAARFALVERDEPDDWRKANEGSWTFFQPVGAELAEQGWKVHVSVTAADAEETIDIVAKHCFAHRTPFKVLTDPRTHLRMNGKYAPRGSSGKLITIYPATRAALRCALDELDIALEGRRGPYVLSDLRWREGPLYVRYGAFKKMHTVDERGRRVLALRGPDGNFVPDVRGPSFRPPSWVELPDFLAEQQRAATATPAVMPYVTRKALHFSNGGGIYLAADPVTGEPVVLREARPLAGLDGAGDDAVARLQREAETLRELGDLDFVPTFKGTFVCWEHHFLAQEHIEGQTLWDFLATRNPAVRGASGPDDFAAYARTVSDILDRIEHAISAIHDRGYVYGDLHPRNVLVRPDGRIALVDFEVAYRPGVDPEPTIACPGFVAKHAQSGRSRDTYALDCLRVAAFLPLTQMLDLDAGKAQELPEAVAELFPVRHLMTAALVERLRPASAREAAGPRHGGEFAAAARNPGGAGMRALLDSMTRAIAASATPRRADRLFPGDPKALEDGGYTLAHGAAGVLYALHSTGQPVDRSHVAWLSSATRRVPARAGLWDGLHGAALVLHGLGHEREACEALDRAAPAARAVTSPALYDGLAGIALALRYMAVATGDPHWRSALDAVTDRLAGTVSALDGDARASEDDARSGLMHGFTGAALFFLRRHQDTRDNAYLDVALRALEIDLERCRLRDSGEVVMAQGARLMPYLGIGSGGLVEAIDLYLRHVPDERLAAWRTGILRACEVPFTIEPGLLMGRAGLMMTMAAHAASPGSTDALASHVRRLAWHAVPRDGGPGAGRTVAFPGHRLLRLSMDLASGTAGVLLALHSSARAAQPAAHPAGGTATWRESTGLPLTAAQPR
ncbi:class III lanthionine synthetase LanKC [Saccharothrix coeruleofusca]|uniref:Serine/threonine protein kinase n=1 Tax=Saccharothrix coeruleofusca TaxID=33919 RepID=A0A918EHP2_9PSEU|nr:class III lanthionine synthetase LanKC [Saccharothrix coeruleofusca]GGP79297.1 serine/threonine protein kinase [Saccharothrix coeruleofusca]